MSRYILNEVETSHHLILIRLYFILTILITEDDHNHIVFAHLIHRRIFLFSTPCGVWSLVCMRNINCKPHWLAICCLSRIFYFFLDQYREHDVKVWKHFKVYFKCGWNMSPFDINSVVFQFDDFNYGMNTTKRNELY
jgi:sRNA-binding regulator protein Hfq